MAMQLQKSALDAGIVTRDLERAARFYGDVLGLPLAGEISMPGIGLVRRYAVGESTLRIFVPEATPVQEGSGEGFASRTGIRYLTLAIANLEETVAAVAAAGFKVPMAPKQLRPGIRVAQIEDGDGNTLELMQHDA
jgi:predicted enzyme related to lactoylglutathione lyase